MKYADPSGHCPAPAEGQAAICLAFFIRPATVTPAGIAILGDDRGFSSNSSPDASRAWVIIPLDGSAPQVQINASHYVLPGGAIVETEASSANSLEIYRQRGGQITVAFDLVLSGPYEWVAPHINGLVSFIPQDDGYRVSVVRDGFPWAEAYYHDGQGNVVTLFQDPAINGDPRNLGALGDEDNWINGANNRVTTFTPSISALDRHVSTNPCVPGRPC